MSRRPPAPADRTEQNRATLKQLVKVEANKSCADCKINKHPRWASWNIGIFLCIRCSGIHRGMGTHISRVKSVDLDSWTDEQMQNMLRWGNARANKYWEHKLADGHVPNESKIQNFIRTKYDSKRWVMDGPMPDPTTLDDGTADDDVPLNVVREKAIERSASMRNGSGSGPVLSQPPKSAPQNVDLFGDTDEPSTARPSTTEPAQQRPGPPKAAAAPPKQTRPGESLLGLDFLGGPSSTPPRPSSTGGNNPGLPGRADLKSSILSLYAAKPAAPPTQPPTQQQQQHQSNMDAFAGMQSPPLVSPTQTRQNEGLNDAFSSLSFTSQPQSQVQSAPFSNLASSGGQQRQSTQSALSGGTFFDTKPALPTKQTSPPVRATTTARKESFGGDFGDFSSGASPTTSVNVPPTNKNSMGDLFGLSDPPPPSRPVAPSAPAPIQAQQPSYSSNSAFNLTQPAVQPTAAKPSGPALTNFSNLNTMDAWGSNNAWASSDAAPQGSVPPIQTSAANTFKPAPPPAMQTPFDSGWGDVTSPTKSAGAVSVQQDEEFGGWSHASPVATNSAGPKQSSGGGFGGTTDDLFGNVWE